MKKSSNVKVFRISTYRNENPLKIIKLFFQDIKFCYQRIKYGWCERDSWGIDMWFLEVMPQILQCLRDNRHGYPGTMTSEEWDEILDELIFNLREANEETCSQINQYDIFDKNFLNRYKEIDEYRNKCKDRALYLFNEFFWHLWD